MRWVIVIIVLVGLAIAGVAVYAFSRFGRLTPGEGLILGGIAIAALAGIAVALWLFVKNLNDSTKNK